ncbi:MAG: START domain-containing protein [Leptospirales bacterium]|nr:START domain-containing protein [Leptospirales bacterium]
MQIKKISGLVLFILSIVISPLISPSKAESQWERAKSSNMIEVFVRPVPGSAIKEFRAVTEVQSSMSAILALLDDTSSYTKWMHRCTEAKLLYEKNIYERITYNVTSSPWPVEDRDIAVRSVISQNKKTLAVTIALTGLPGYVPVKPKKVRIVKLSGYWMLEPLGAGRLRVTYRLHSEPGGSVPETLVNSSLVDIPYNTLHNLRRMVNQSPYKDAKYDEIIEK